MKVTIKMKLVTFIAAGIKGAGYIDKEEIIVCVEGDAAHGAVDQLVRTGTTSAWADLGATARRIPLADARLLAPIPEPRRDIFCVGKNYFAHAAEFHSSGFDSSSTEEIPQVPIIFTKATTSVVGPGEVVRGSLDWTQTVDYEGELGVVIGKRAAGVSREDALQHVFGYVALNDVTSRQLQRHHGQWVIGKGIDTFCPMGPFLATTDEVGDVTELRLQTEVNGEVRQDAKVSDLIFDIPSLIETLSRTMTLLPGDIIATGTPAGVGIGFEPPKYLQEGDRMTVRITELGELTNTIG